MLPWMVGNPSHLVMRDAVMVVLKTQELAGLDLVTDGELMRFDPSHPETNGMVDYFISRLDGIRKVRSPALPIGLEIIVDGFQAKDGSNRANGRDITFPDGTRLFVGSSGTGAPDEKRGRR